MPKKAHTEEQIVAVLRQVQAGARVDEVCRKVGISQATYYLWKRKYTGVGVSELRELRQLREEVGRLKRLVADLSLDRQMLQEIVSKKLQGLVRVGSWRAGRRRPTGSASGMRRGWCSWRSGRCATRAGKCWMKCCAIVCGRWRERTCATAIAG